MPKEGLSGIKILLIDDDPLVAKTLKKLLERAGYRVTSATSAKEGIALAGASDFNLVISDIRMPGQSGIVAVQKIKEAYEAKGVPCGFMFITGYAEEDSPAHAIRLGVNKFLFKPFDNEAFLTAVREELALLEEERKLKEAAEAPPLLPRKKPVRERLPLKRVVITGIGVIAPSGIGKEAYWKGLREGKNCVDRISSFDCSTFPSKMAAEIRDFNPHDFIQERNEIKRMGRSSHLAIAATKLALEDANLNGPARPGLGVVIGSAVSGVEYIEPDMRALERGGVRKVRPFLGIAGFAGAISSEVSRAIGAQGPSLTISTGCTSSTDAFGYALKQIRYGESEILVVGGADACVTSGIVAAFSQMGALSTRKDDFSKASRPFDRDRDGFVIAEGSWIFILEELEHALKRKAKIYGELIGYGATCDAWHMARPHPSGEYTAAAIRGALEDAGIEPGEVDLFEAYGNATPINDSYETAVVKKVFGKHAEKFLMPSVKSMLGHPIGAAGAQQLAAALLALNEGYIHPTINYEVPDPECDLDYVPNQGREGKFRAAVCNSLAFGAKNAAIVVKKYE